MANTNSSMTRKQANLLILEDIKKFIEDFPDQRFHQVLQNLNIEKADGVDYFHEESLETFQKMSKPTMVKGVWDYRC